MLAALDESSDALELAARLDGILVVVDARTTRQRAFASTLDILVLAGGSIAGVVLTNAAPVAASLPGRSLPHRDRNLRELART